MVKNEHIKIKISIYFQSKSYNTESKKLDLKQVLKLKITFQLIENTIIYLSTLLNSIIFNEQCLLWLKTEKSGTKLTWEKGFCIKFDYAFSYYNHPISLRS